MVFLKTIEEEDGNTYYILEKSAKITEPMIKMGYQITSRDFLVIMKRILNHMVV